MLFALESFGANRLLKAPLSIFSESSLMDGAWQWRNPKQAIRMKTGNHWKSKDDHENAFPGQGNGTSKRTSLDQYRLARRRCIRSYSSIGVGSFKATAVSANHSANQGRPIHRSSWLQFAARTDRFRLIGPTLFRLSQLSLTSPYIPRPFSTD